MPGEFAHNSASYVARAEFIGSNGPFVGRARRESGGYPMEKKLSAFTALPKTEVVNRTIAEYDTFLFAPE